MSDNFAHSTIWKTTDAIIGITLLLGLVLHFVPSLNIVFPIPAQLRIVVGMVLVLAGVLAVVLARRGLKSAGQP